MDEENDEVMPDEEENNEQENNNEVQQIRANRRKKVTKNVAKAASKSPKFSKIASAVLKIIWPLALAIVIILLLVGLISFIIFGFGLIWGGISNILEGIGDWWKSITNGEQTIVKAETVEDTMNWLKSMDYDLYGYGFVTREDSSKDGASGWSIDSDGKVKVDQSPAGLGSKFDQLAKGNDFTGTVSGDSDEIRGIKNNTFRYLITYIVSDNYANLIKNSNKNFASTFDNPIEFWKGVFNGDGTGFGAGLLSVYYQKEDGVIGEKGNSVDNIGSWFTDFLNEGIDIITGSNEDHYNAATVKIKDGKLVVSSGAASNIKFRYDLDGWVGRYGMPLEFLLSVHAATMAPDLAYKMATSFDTDVQILLKKSGVNNGEVRTGVVQKRKENIDSTANFITSEGYDQLPEDEDTSKYNVVVQLSDLTDVIGDIDYSKIDRKKVMDMFRNTPLVSPERCVGIDSGFAVTYTTDYLGIVENYYGEFDHTNYHILGDMTGNNNGVYTINAYDNDYVIPSFTDHPNLLQSISKDKLCGENVENGELDKISNVRQLMYAMCMAGLWDANHAKDQDGNNLSLINADKPVQEINMDEYTRTGREGYNEDESGTTEGEEVTEYTIFEGVDESDDSGNAFGNFINSRREKIPLPTDSALVMDNLNTDDPILHDVGDGDDKLEGAAFFPMCGVYAGNDQYLDAEGHLYNILMDFGEFNDNNQKYYCTTDFTVSQSLEHHIYDVIFNEISSNDLITLQEMDVEGDNNPFYEFESGSKQKDDDIVFDNVYDRDRYYVRNSRSARPNDDVKHFIDLITGSGDNAFEVLSNDEDEIKILDDGGTWTLPGGSEQLSNYDYINRIMNDGSNSIRIGADWDNKSFRIFAGSTITTQDYVNSFDNIHVPLLTLIQRDVSQEVRPIHRDNSDTDGDADVEEEVEIITTTTDNTLGSWRLNMLVWLANVQWEWYRFKDCVVNNLLGGSEDRVIVNRDSLDDLDNSQRYFAKRYDSEKVETTEDPTKYYKSSTLKSFSTDANYVSDALCYIEDTKNYTTISNELFAINPQYDDDVYTWRNLQEDDYTDLSLIKYNAKFKGHDTQAKAWKPVLKDFSYTFSFVNESVSPDENGNGGEKTYITITITTTPQKQGHRGEAALISADDSHYFTVSAMKQQEYRENGFEEDDDSLGSCIDYHKMGDIEVDIRVDKIEDNELVQNEDGTYGRPEEERCSQIAKREENEEYCCAYCYNYVKQIYKSLKGTTELQMTTYYPYINRVTDHWFRNVYFTKKGLDEYNAEIESNNYTESYYTGVREKENYIIQNHDEYEKITGERWTKYQTVTENGKEKYVLILDDGYNLEFGETDSNTFIETDNEDIETFKSEGFNYFVKDEDGISFRKARDDEVNNKSIKKYRSKYTNSYIENNEEFKFYVHKRAIKDSINDYADNWSAYDPTPHTIDTGWKILSPSNEDLADMNTDLKKLLTRFDDLTVVADEKYEIIKQIEDGIRGETNKDIKNLFRDEYYIYDGSQLKAEWIEKAKRLTPGNDFDNPEKYRDKYGEDKNIMRMSLTDDTNNMFASINDISGKINLNKDSLNAFAILKNMKTLDSEYIYRDFKELIVELNYFNKEDLIEREAKTMMFPVSGLNSLGWSDAKLDKGINYYGTLIHSAYDYEVLSGKRIETTEGEQQETTTTTTTTQDANDNQNEAIILLTGQGSSSKFHKKTLKETAEACWEHVVNKEYTYKDADNTTGIQIPAADIGLMNEKIFLQWVLYEYGYEEFYEAPGGTELDFDEYFTDDTSGEHGWKKHGWSKKVFPPKDDRNQEMVNYLKVGDIVYSQPGGEFGSAGESGKHCFIISRIEETETNKKIYAYKCGALTDWNPENKVAGVNVTNMMTTRYRTFKVLRIDSREALEEFKGYEGGEPVLAPVTGQVIDYGTVERTNIETGINETVGYIKIKILAGKDERFVANHIEPEGGTENSVASAFIRSNYTGDEIKKLGYDYFTEEYEEAGIAGNILYLEGFDISKIITDPDNSSESTNEENATQRYGDFDINNMNSDSWMAQHDAVEIGADIVNQDLGNTIDDSEVKTSNVVVEHKTNIEQLKDYILGSGTQGSTSSTNNSNTGGSTTTTASLSTSATRSLENGSESSGTDTKSIQVPNRYQTQYVIPDLLDEAQEFKLKVQEEAKREAAFAIEFQNKIYIKEGAVIGYTYYSSATEGNINSGQQSGVSYTYVDEDGNEHNKTGTIGNYMRMILRDLREEVVENVEDYVETANNKFTGRITEQFKYWMAFTSEAALVYRDEDGNPLDDNDRYKYYASIDGGDEMGNSGPFGLTYCCSGIAESIGYKDFEAHRLGYVDKDDLEQNYDPDNPRNGKIPLAEGDDVFTATLEVERQDVLSKLVANGLEKKVTDYIFLALVDVRHAGPVMLDAQISKFAAKGYITKRDFEDNWGTADQFAGGLQGRAKRRGILAIDEKYTAGSQGTYYEVIWKSTAPWSSYLEKHDHHYSGEEYGYIFGGEDIELISYNPD